MNKRISHPESFCIPSKVTEKNKSVYMLADKTCILERNGLKLLASTTISSSLQEQEFNISITLAPFCSGKREIHSRLWDLERFLVESIRPSLRLEDKNCVQVSIQVLEYPSFSFLKQDLVNITSLSLANHGVEMNDLVVACTLGLCNGKVVLENDDYDGMITLCYMPRLQAVSNIQQEGKVSLPDLKTGFEMGVDYCSQMVTIMEKALLKN